MIFPMCLQPILLNLPNNILPLLLKKLQSFILTIRYTRHIEPSFLQHFIFPNLPLLRQHLPRINNIMMMPIILQNKPTIQQKINLISIYQQIRLKIIVVSFENVLDISLCFWYSGWVSGDDLVGDWEVAE